MRRDKTLTNPTFLQVKKVKPRVIIFEPGFVQKGMQIVQEIKELGPHYILVSEKDGRDMYQRLDTY